MGILIFALVVGVLFATGTYLILRRSPIRLILGLALLSHGVNLLLFSSGGLGRGMPPIIPDKENVDPTIIDRIVDPLPQALILTAIVISFGVTAFTVVLVNRRNALSQRVAQDVDARSDVVPSRKALDPFAPLEHYITGLDQEPDDYEWLEYGIADEYRRRQQAAAERQQTEQTKMAVESTPDGHHNGDGAAVGPEADGVQDAVTVEDEKVGS